ncbi:PBP1b-binding outer membrane lipoprotein LpoB [Rahnella sp. BIGb0603]|jgi:PBP1b-binding outer membrane lipoprotein LpoB|nr:PBP1b-binding outer membrane lipoprotein LpoB [Rahnella sp. BIGb0603]
MFKQANILTICISAFILSSCARATDKTLSQSSDTQWVNVEVKNPSQYTKPFPLEVRYISHKCLKKRIS